MHCHQAQKKLNELDWQSDRARLDSELAEHLDNCPECSALLKSEEMLRSDIRQTCDECPSSELTIGRMRENVEGRRTGWLAGYRPIVVTAAVVVLCLLAVVPFNFREKIGYGISISGIDKEIAQDSNGIGPLLDALGLEKDRTEILLDSLEINKVRLLVGECTETCHLEISDLKTEKDVQLVIQAIIELGCCEIDEVFPIFKDESSSLLKHATRKLFS